MSAYDDDVDLIHEMKEAQKPKDNLRLLMNRKNFDRFELEELMNDFE